MKIINCGIVIYLITKNHIARIERTELDGAPAWAIYYDNMQGEIVQGPTAARAAFDLARWEVRWMDWQDKR